MSATESAASWRRVAAVAAATGGGWTLVSLVVADPLALRVASGVPLPVIGVPLPSPGPATPDELVARVLIVIGVVVVAGAAAAARWPGGGRRFLTAPSAALDLAVVRVVVFGVLLVLPRVPEAIELSGLPPELRVPPAGMPWLLDVIPTSPATVRPLALVFQVACLLACLGLWTRPAAVVAAVVGLHLLGVPQFFGKVSHYHHLWWASALLAASPCGDALSVDALRRGWRRPGGPPARDLHGVRYGLPLRLLWLLIALTYFFPGLWKFASAGWEWAFSDNLRNIMYEHWARLDGFSPILPIDRPPYTEVAGVLTILFELSFVMLVLSPRIRPWLAATGLTFHNANFLFLRLGFFTLQVLYASFVPWQRVADAIGRRRGPVRVDVAPTAHRARRLVGAADAVDPFGGTAVAATDGPALVVHGPRGRREGARAAATVAARSPLLWPAWPVLRLVPSPLVERWLDGGPDPGLHAETPTAGRRAPSGAVASAVVGAALIAGVVLAGLLQVARAWPLAAYPSFAGIHGDTIFRLSLEFVAADGSRQLISSERLRSLVSEEKYQGLTNPILRAGDNPPVDRILGLVAVIDEAGLTIPDAGVVVVLRDTERLSRDGPEVVNREVLGTVRLP